MSEQQHRTKLHSQQIMERGTKCLVQQKNIIKATYKSAPYPDPAHHSIITNPQTHIPSAGGVVHQHQITQPSIVNNASTQLLENVVISNSGGGKSNLVVPQQQQKQEQPQPPTSPSKSKLTRNRRATGRHESRYTSGKIYIEHKFLDFYSITEKKFILVVDDIIFNHLYFDRFLQFYISFFCNLFYIYVLIIFFSLYCL